jgi:hypothetical protein
LDFDQRSNYMRETISYVMPRSAVNRTRVARVVNEAMRTLWPDGVKLDIALLLVTEAVPYMQQAAERLPASYPKLIQAMCVADVLHRVSETLRVLYQNADKLVTN